MSKMDEKYEKKFEEMEWYAITYSINRKEMEMFNIFRSGHFCDGLKRLLKEKGKTMDEFVKELHRISKYAFWCKCEYEIEVDDHMPCGRYEAVLEDDAFTIKHRWFSLPGVDAVYKGDNVEAVESNKFRKGACYVQMRELDTSKKIDVYTQLQPNMERLAEYIIRECGYRIAKQ